MGRGYSVLKKVAPGQTVTFEIKAKVAAGATQCVKGVRVRNDREADSGRRLGMGARQRLGDRCGCNRSHQPSSGGAALRSSRGGWRLAVRRGQPDAKARGSTPPSSPHTGTDEDEVRRR